MTAPEAKWQPNWKYIGIGVFVLAFALRVWYVMTAHVDGPVRGDASQYVAYAMNLVNHGVFSHEMSGAPRPDAFRTPGYPLLIAGVSKLSAQNWYSNLLLLQCIFGAACAVMTVAIARGMMRPGFAVASGILVAIWPHSISVNGYLITETLFGFLFLLCVYLLVHALRVDGFQRAFKARQTLVVAGLMAALAYLVNPMMLVAIVALAIFFVFIRKPWVAGIFFAIAMIGPIGWGVRNHMADMPAENANSARAWINLVQGAAPEYHSAYRGSLMGDVRAMEQMKAIDIAQNRATRDHIAAFNYVAERFSEQPARFIKWYAIDKALLLWDWDIRMGQGDIYVYPTFSSPFESSPVLSTWKRIAHWLNPALAWLTLLTCCTALVSLWRVNRAAQTTRVWLLVATVTGAMTLLHMVFQAEPRYAIPYRPFQFLVCLYALHWMVDVLRRRIAARRASAPTNA